MAFNVNALGFGDNVVDRYEHIHTMYPGGNAVNFAVYAKKCGAARCAYMGIFGNDAAAEHVIASLEDEGIELDKCEQMIGENGAARVLTVTVSSSAPTRAVSVAMRAMSSIALTFRT